MGGAREPLGEGAVSFARPDLLALIALLPATAALGVLGYARRRRRVARRLGDPELLARLGAGELERFPLVRLLLVVAAAAALGIAAAGPRWGFRTVEGRAHALNVVLALDVSRSMRARDVEPDRLERERVLAHRLLRELSGARFGLVVFAGRAYILSPLTVDHAALRLFVDALDPEIVSQGGTSLASAITQASDLARGVEGGGERAVVLVSDGEALEERDAVMMAAARARRLGVVVHTVGIGTPGGAPIPEREPGSMRITGYTRDETGEIVISKLDEELLRRVARETGGRYVRLGAAGATNELIAAIRALEPTRLEGGRRVEPREQYVWFVLLALLLLAVDVLAAPGRLRLLGRFLALALVLTLGACAVGERERGNRLYRRGEYAGAAAAYREALSDEATPELRYNLGTALLRQDSFPAAERELRQALRSVEPELRQRAHYNLGNRYLVEGRAGADTAGASELLERAVEAYKQALRIAPADSAAKWNLELALREQERQQQQAQSPQGGGGGESREQEQEPPGEAAGAGATSQPRPTGGDRAGTTPQHAPMGREQAERILNAVEQDERELQQSRLRRAQRETPVRRDW